MATIAAKGAITASTEAKAVTGEPIADSEAEADHGIPRFFYAAGAALVLSAIQGVVQRLPGISDWLAGADYGGHMVSDLAHTHITIVGAGTISLTGLIYYVLPRVTRRPLYSKALTNISFWFTLIGVFSFYLAMIGVGLYEGAMVHAGWGYEAARDFLGAWHKAPMAITAATMGIGYWTFVANVYITVGRASGERRVFPGTGPTDSEFLLAKFFVVGATGLLFGTIQGVYQVLPWSLDWLHATGEAGKMIDPMAHAHINLVGGVAVSLMGLLYYFIPKILDRPVFSLKLGIFSFWCILIGVFAFYFSAIGLGWIEGERVLSGMTDIQAQASMGIWHPLLLASAASIMGLGFWSFIANIFLTLRQKYGPDAPADRKLIVFIGVSSACILVGTIQGVIQILPPVARWLDEALPSGYFVTPLAHAQLNMVGFVIISLTTLMFFLLPRLMGRPIVDPVRGRRALLVMTIGIVSTYIVYLTVGLLESIQIHNGLSPEQAREAVAGVWGRYALFVGAQAILGVGYILLFRHISEVIGKENIRAYFRVFRGRMSGAIQQSVRIHPRARAADLATAQKRAIGSSLMEVIFLGLGWFFSGRPFVGIMMFSLGAIYLTVSYVVVAVAGNDSPFPYLIATYAALIVLSGIGCYRSYMRDSRLGSEAGA